MLFYDCPASRSILKISQNKNRRIYGDLLFFCSVWITTNINLTAPLQPLMFGQFFSCTLSLRKLVVKITHSILSTRIPWIFSSGAGSKRVMRNRLPPNGAYVWPSDRAWRLIGSQTLDRNDCKARNYPDVPK